MKLIKSPCINVCEYNPEGNCKGCYRSKTEITGWVNYSDDQKKQVLLNASERRNSSGYYQNDYDYYV